jgi:hypothetical protein
MSEQFRQGFWYHRLKQYLEWLLHSQLYAQSWEDHQTLFDLVELDLSRAALQSLALLPCDQGAFCPENVRKRPSQPPWRYVHILSSAAEYMIIIIIIIIIIVDG